MTYRLLISYFFLCAAACGSPPDGGNGSSSDTDVFTRKVSDSEDLVIVRGPTANVEVVRHLLGPGALPKTTGVYAVRLELRSKSATPIVLWTRMKREYELISDNGIDVLDVIYRPNAIILATAEGVEVKLWYYNLLFGDAEVSHMSCGDWTNLAQPIHLDHNNINVTLGIGADGKTVTATVVQRGEPVNQRAVYEQVHGEWRFRLISLDPPIARMLSRVVTPAARPGVSPAQVVPLAEVLKWGAAVAVDGNDGDRQVAEIDLSFSKFTDAACTAFDSLPGLRQLDLSSTNVSDVGLAHIQSLKRLQSLRLRGLTLKEAGLQYLEHPDVLQNLDLSETGVADLALKQLRRFTALTALDLSSLEISDIDLQYVGPLSGLRTLGLRRTHVTDGGIKDLRCLTNLRSLDLCLTEITDNGLKYVRELRNLEVLNLEDTHVTNTGLEELTGMTQLRVLRLSGTEATSVGVRKLKDSLPKCDVIGP